VGLPSGTVTLLFTDIEGSTRLLHELGDRYVQVLAEHRRTLRNAVAAHNGVEVDTQGDAFFIAFKSAADAVAAAHGAQRELTGSPVRVRMGIHTGEPTVTPEGYVGIDVHRGARICAAGHGGQVLISKVTRDHVAELVELRDLGEHRLKDLPTPEWLFQVLAPDLEPSFPPLRSLSNTNLPAEASKFIGRQRELTETSELLSREDVRVLTLTGAGGSGKTRLSIRLAAEFVERFKNGVFFVSLGAVSDPARVLGAIAQTLGAKEDGAEGPADALRRYLEGKQVLLVLDNFEQLLAAAPHVSLLLASAPQVKVIVTSRERLRLAGEHEFAVPPLPEEDAVTLFDVRARAAKASFRVDLHRAPVLAICRRLDGLPLAVELAAARVKVFQPDALFARLEQRLPVLTGGPRDMPDRQRTLRATIEWSYLLLDQHEQDVLRRLSVFAGGFGVAAAEQVCGATLDELASLHDKSLLRRDDGPGDEPRFSMLQTIREYAEELLEVKDETQEVRASHAHYYADLADSKCLGRGHGVPLPEAVQRSRPEWQDWLDLERENLAKALGSLIDSRQAEAAVQMILSTWRLWFVRGPLRDGQLWTEKVLALDDAKLSPDYGWFLTVAAEYPRFRGDDARAKVLEEQAIPLLRSRGEKFRLGACIEALANIVQSQGDHERARRLHEECLAIGREINDKSVIAHALNGLGGLAFRQGDYVRMAALAEEEVALSRETGAGLSEALGSLAEARRRLRQLDSAATLFHEALRFADDLGEVGTLAECLDGIGDVAADRDDPASAVLLWAVSRRLLDELGQPPWDPEGAEQGMNAARLALSAEVFEKLWREGQSMSRDEAVAKATAIAAV